MQPPLRMGLVVIGDELLSGKRRDTHLAHVIEVLAGRGMALAWCRYVGDDDAALHETFRQTQDEELPVLCFGGIGATPDDRTRAAAARAFGAPLVRHPEAVRLIEQQFGEAAYPNRVRMAELPEDCLLIPNAFNAVPGFTLYEHHFFPGFPHMAWPMLDWVLETYYPECGEIGAEYAVRVRGTTESALLELMETLSERHREIKLFSLPHMGTDAYIELGVRGLPAAAERAFCDLVGALNARRLSFEFTGDDAGVAASRCG